MAGRQGQAPGRRTGPGRDGRRHRRRPSRVGRVRARLARHLGRTPCLAGCSGRQLHELTRWGDLVEVETGSRLVQEGRRDNWFFIVLSGTVELTRRGRTIRRVGPGGHFGESAVVGFGLQPATAVAREPSLVFVLGPRYLLSLLSTSSRFREALFPGVGAAEYPDFVRGMIEQAGAEWLRLAPPVADRPPADQVRPPGQPISLHAAVRRLSGLPDSDPVTEPGPEPGPGGPARARHRLRWVRPAGAVAALAACAGLLFGYHPPMVVVGAGAPINVASDIKVTGIPSHPPRGRFLLLWVDIRRESLAGSLLAFVTGGLTERVPNLSRGEEAATYAAGRQAYWDSQRYAVKAVAADLGLSPNRFKVTFRDRGFIGPSAGLVYALALEDMIGGRHLAAGRVVAASGEITSDGTVEPIGFLDLKTQAAARAGASVLLVPGAELGAVPAGTAGLQVWGVGSLYAAVAALLDR